MKLKYYRRWCTTGTYNVFSVKYKQYKKYKQDTVGKSLTCFYFRGQKKNQVKWISGAVICIRRCGEKWLLVTKGLNKSAGVLLPALHMLIYEDPQ